MTNTVKALEPLLEPQERLDRLIAATFRRFGPRLVDMSYANPADGPAAEVLDVLKQATARMTGLTLQYTPCGGRMTTRRAIAARLRDEYGLAFHPRDIVMTTGAMSALNLVFKALFAPDDEVIVLTPAWQDYPLYLRNLNVPTAFVPLGANKRLDVDAIGRAVGPSTRGLLFSQPCCPTGVLYSREEIEAVADVLRRAGERFGTSIYWVSDEVHRHLIWSAKPFYSPLVCYPRSLSIYSFGKALALQGQRIGYVAVSPRMAENDDVRTTLERCLRVMGFGNPTSLMQSAVCDLLDCRPAVETLEQKQAFVRRTLTGYGYQVCDGDATFYVYVKSPLQDDFRFTELLANEGVVVVPATLFRDPGYVRLSLTARFEAIATGMPAFARVLEALGGRPALSAPSAA